MPYSGIFVEEPFYKKAKFWRGVIAAGFVLLFLIYFWGEIGLFFRFIGFLLGRTVLPPTVPELLRAFVILVINFLALITFFFLSLLLVSQFVLPVQTNAERSKVFDRLLLYFQGGHGPAIFVKEGREIGKAEELQSSRPGVAFIDLSSAIALEKHWVPVATSGVSRGRVSSFNFLNPRRIIRKLSPRPQVKSKSKAVVRVAGPGIVFTEWGERIRDVADLRRHLKFAKNVSVSTRDGFNIQANVTVIFTLGEPPEVLKVTYVDGMDMENLRGIRVDEKKKIIAGLSDEFDTLDKAEIHQYILTYVPSQKPVEKQKKKTKEWAKPPYSFDEQRVFAALYSRARNIPEGSVENWNDLPTKVAVEIFRDMLSQEDYNALYRPDDPDSFPFFESFRPKFSRAVRNLGLLAFQFVRRKDGLPLTIGQPWDEDELEFFPVQQLHTPKVLRERGIKIIVASISELSPIHPGVRGQLVEFWQARWQQEAELTEAEAALAALKVQSKARAEAQTDMIRALSQIFDEPNLSREALVLRLFQTLETAATDSRTKSLLPGETLNVLGDLRRIFMLSGGK
jgi:hypothetical protein